MLTDGQKLQFIEDGYCTVQLDLDPAFYDVAIDMTWSQIDPHFKRNDPSSWTGDVRDDCRVATIAKRRGRLKFKTVVARHPALMDMMFGTGPVMAAARDLIGESAVGRRITRGLYPIFPSPTSSRLVTGGMDAHPFQVDAILYLDDVGDDGGEFCLWKGSHYIMARAFPGRASWDMAKDIDALREEVYDNCQRVTLPGPRGQLILWHHRALHTPMTNRSDKVRYALLADYHRDDWMERKDLPHGPDLWEDWGIADFARAYADTRVAA